MISSEVNSFYSARISSLLPIVWLNKTTNRQRGDERRTITRKSTDVDGIKLVRFTNFNISPLNPPNLTVSIKLCSNSILKCHCKIALFKTDLKLDYEFWRDQRPYLTTRDKLG